jgi:U6 snRNA-associated Sm-like protein LSm6
MSAEPENAPGGGGENENVGDARDPSGFLSEIIGAPVTVKLNSGVVYKGACPSVCAAVLRMVSASTGI